MNWPQLKTILWLRYRLTRNQWAKSGGLGAVLAVILALALLALGVLGFGGGALAGAYALGNKSPMIIMAIWAGLTVGFLFFWLIGLLQELQRSETIDLQRLMHLPVQLGQIFVVNYIASHLALSIAVMVPTMIGLALGLAWSRGLTMLLLIPLALSMVYMVTAWTYYLRGWLAVLMNNPRKRRAVIMGVSFGVILLVQAPNLYFNVIRRHDTSSSRSRSKETPEQALAREAEDQKQLDMLLVAEKVVPPLWVPGGAKALAEGSAWPALGGILGCFAIGSLGLSRAYRSTLRFYLGDSGAKASVRAAPRPVERGASSAAAGLLLVERQLGPVPEQAAAVTTATWRCMLRAPEVKMQLGASFMVLLIIGGSVLFRSGGLNLSDGSKPFALTAAMMFSLFFMVQFLANQFGFDREGFRALVLSPVDRRLILIGKNLAYFPAPAVSASLLVAIVAAKLGAAPLVVLAAAFQLVAGLLMLGMAGNLMSILMPYRLQSGTLKPTKLPGFTVFIIVLMQMAFPFAMSPLMLAPLGGYLSQRTGGLPAGPVDLATSIVLATVLVTVYWRTLGPMGRLLQRRETKILSKVTAEVE